MAGDWSWWQTASLDQKNDHERHEWGRGCQDQAVAGMSPKGNQPPMASEVWEEGSSSPSRSLCLCFLNVLVHFHWFIQWFRSWNPTLPQQSLVPMQRQLHRKLRTKSGQQWMMLVGHLSLGAKKNIRNHMLLQPDLMSPDFFVDVPLRWESIWQRTQARPMMLTKLGWSQLSELLS